MFKHSGITNITSGGSKVRVKIGDIPLNLILLTGLEGTQPYRTQIDVALDETTYPIGAGKALGTHTFGLIDGPFDCKLSAEPVLTKLAEMREISSRKLELTMKIGGMMNTAKFTGIISNFNIKLVDTLVEGSYYILVTITANGVWET